jgi:hypothetical protein
MTILSGVRAEFFVFSERLGEGARYKKRVAFRGDFGLNTPIGVFIF